MQPFSRGSYSTIGGVGNSSVVHCCDVHILSVSVVVQVYLSAITAGRTVT